LAYLLLQRHRSYARDALAGLFWADYSQERARSSLNVSGAHRYFKHRDDISACIQQYMPFNNHDENG
jgi:DNA-binding SARP family transcriptional activator